MNVLGMSENASENLLGYHSWHTYESRNKQQKKNHTKLWANLHVTYKFMYKNIMNQKLNLKMRKM